MSVTVRPARAEDHPVLVEYNSRLAQESEGKALPHDILSRGVAAVLRDANRGRYWVAEIAGEVVGQLMVTLEWSDWRDGWLWWIQSVYVRADARRAGVFRALYANLVEEARRQGDVVGLRLYVEHHNEAAQATYKRLGMVDAGYLVLERCPLEVER
ncbi:MAG: GNAT family N-acetyltransferase [Gemmataceae bacterium]|nr:GNAT family N-acetyltransferase [Gemmataceae bacterium]